MTRRSTLALSILVVLAAAAPGCGDGGGGRDPDGARAQDTTGSDAAGGSSLDELIAQHPATIDVSFRGDTTGGFYATTIVAELREDAPPTPYVEVQRAGACVRLASEVPFCDPPCAGDTLCTAADTCTPVPPLESAGVLTVAAGDATVPVTPTGATYLHDEQTVLFAGGETLTASAPGADFDAFSLSTQVPVPLGGVVASGIEAGSPFTVTWTPGDPGSRVALQLIADLGHNPVHPSVIFCDAADEAGELEVPVELVAPHVDPANWSCGDCFPSHLRRMRIATGTAGAVPTRLTVRSAVQLFVVPGR